MLEAEFDEDGKARGDIVLITDGECGVREDWMRAWNDRKHRPSFRVFGVAVGAAPGPGLSALSDNVRTITDLTSPNETVGMFRVT